MPIENICRSFDKNVRVWADRLGKEKKKEYTEKVKTVAGRIRASDHHIKGQMLYIRYCDT